MEKEHKIINPHKMEMTTTNISMYKKFDVKPHIKKPKSIEKNDAPVANTSSYTASFPHWENGKNDIFHEKHPQYPVYSLPFKGRSSYRQNFTDE